MITIILMMGMKVRVNKVINLELVIVIYSQRHGAFTDEANFTRHIG